MTTRLASCRSPRAIGENRSTTARRPPGTSGIPGCGPGHFEPLRVEQHAPVRPAARARAPGCAPTRAAGARPLGQVVARQLERHAVLEPRQVARRVALGDRAGGPPCVCVNDRRLGPKTRASVLGARVTGSAPPARRARARERVQGRVRGRRRVRGRGPARLPARAPPAGPRGAPCRWRGTADWRRRPAPRSASTRAAPRPARRRRRDRGHQDRDPERRADLAGRPEGGRPRRE